MEVDNKKMFFAMGLIAFFLISVIVSQYFNAVRKAGEKKTRMEEVGKLQFKGRVINSKTYKYGGRNCYLICVKLSSTNVQSFHVNNKLDCLDIKNDIATFSAGYLNHTLGATDSVAVNMSNSGKIIFHYKGNLQDQLPLAFDPMGLKESDLSYCN